MSENSRSNSTTLITAVVFFIVAAVLGGLYWQASRYAADIEAQATLTANSQLETITTLEAEAGQARMDLATLEANATQSAMENADAIATLQANSDDMSEALATLEANATQSAIENADAIATLQADADDMANALATAESDITQAQNNVATLEADADALALQATDDSQTYSVQATESAGALQAVEAQVTEAVATSAAIASAYDALGVSATEVAARATIAAEVARLDAITPTMTPVMPVDTVGIDAVLESANIDLNDIAPATMTDDVDFDLTGQTDALVNETLDGRYSDFIITANVTWGTGADDDYCGYIFHRESRSNYYTAEIARDGEVRFFTRNSGQWELGDNSKFAVDANANRITLLAQGDTFILFVNDVQALTFNDQRYTVGELALMAGTVNGEEGAGCTFDDVQVWSLETVLAPDTAMYNGIPAGRTSDGAFLIGYPTAPITLVEFADFACPHCQRYHPTMEDIISEYVATGQARLEFRLFPTVDRDGALMKLAECSAGDNPALFWEIQGVLYEQAANAVTLREIVEGYEAETGLVLDDLLPCTETAQQYLIDQRVGTVANVTGTPTIRLRTPDGALVPIAGYENGGVPYDVLAEAIERAQ